MYTIQQKTAIARIVSDLIKADNIIEVSEINKLKDFESFYYKSKDILGESRKIKFSDAVSALDSLYDQEKIELFKKLLDMAKIDGLCAPREALLLLAIQYAFGIEYDKTNTNTKEYKINRKKQNRVFSCPTGDMSVSSQYIVYIEGKYNQVINDTIKENLELQVLRLRQCGFDFIYIPSLIEEFEKMDNKYVKDVLSYMAPDLSEKQIDAMYERLLSMNTVSFCNYVLADKLKASEIRNTEPSLLINIGTSFVPYCSPNGQVECYTEFLCIPLKEEISVQIYEFMSAYSKLVSFNPIPMPLYLRNDSNRFKYFGFYKALFDFLLRVDPKESDIVIRSGYNNLYFPQGGSQLIELSLTPQQATIYKLILICTCHPKLKGLPSRYTEDNNCYRDWVKKTYQQIYNGANEELPERLAPIIVKIKIRINEQLRDLSNREDFIPVYEENNRVGKYMVKAPLERIKIYNPYPDMVPISKYYWG